MAMQDVIFFAMRDTHGIVGLCTFVKSSLPGPLFRLAVLQVALTCTVTHPSDEPNVGSNTMSVGSFGNYIIPT